MLHRHTGQARQTLRVGLLEGAVATAELTGPIFERYRALRPEVHLDLHYLSFRDQASALVDNAVDVALVRPPLEHPDLPIVPIARAEVIAAITDAVGVDGLYELGGLSRQQVGTKANLLHIWSIGAAVGFGRGIQIALGNIGAGEREADLAAGLQFMRRLYAGAWRDEGGVYASMRGYAAPLLDGHWIERFRDEFDPIDDADKRRVYQRFSAGTELLGFLLHFDNRCGLADTGPYPTGDGGFRIVRDHFLHEPVYHWADVARELPYAITQAMFFEPDEPLRTRLMDGSTLFTKPGNYLKHLTGMACYARDRWDTPVSAVRRLDLEEMGRIECRSREASTRLYARIASMPRRDKVFAGAQVYYTDFILPFARAAGVWDTLVDEHDFFEIDPATAKAYYQLVGDDLAQTLVGQLLLEGRGFPPVQ